MLLLITQLIITLPYRSLICRTKVTKISLGDENFDQRIFLADEIYCLKNRLFQKIMTQKMLLSATFFKTGIPEARHLNFGKRKS